MVKRFCDRCGKEIVDYYGVITLNERPGATKIDYDLCETCVQEFKSFMNKDRYPVEYDAEAWYQRR